MLSMKVSLHKDAGGTWISRTFLTSEEEFGVCKSTLVDWIDAYGGCP